MIKTFFSKTSTIVVLVLLLIAASCTLTFFISRNQMKNEIELAKADLREIRLEEEYKIKRSFSDSILVVKEELANIQKLIIARELIQTKPLDEKKVLDKYYSLSDSTAIRIFTDRYGGR
jgi:hypothetical protein